MIARKYGLLKGREPNILGHESMEKSAVTVPLVNHQGEVKVLFEERAMTLNRQPGEICFPGGAVEPLDRDPAQAAIRETCEELGINRNAIELIAPLDLLVTPYNAIIYPYLCEIKDYSMINPNHREVKSVFCVPIDFFRKAHPLVHDVGVALRPSEDFPFDLIPGGKSYNWRSGTYRVYFYVYEGRLIWGMTARILTHFLALADDIGL